MESYVVLEKLIGETPLQCVEAWRATQPELSHTPLAYAGRLDPMASGALLVLIGDECKRQTEYHNLDKTYTVTVLLGIASDSGDVLGLPTASKTTAIQAPKIAAVLQELQGEVTFPYPHYSSKTVAGKPLHTWTLEGRLHEITIPSKTSTIYNISLTDCAAISAKNVYSYVTEKIETIAPVTETSKALGNDFRRPQIREAWKQWYGNHNHTSYTLATITCTASSGTYMRTLAAVIGDALNTPALAYHIHRDCLGTYDPQREASGAWLTHYQAIPRAF